MKVTHKFIIKSKCPVDGTEDSYRATVTPKKFVMVEEILDVVAEITGTPIYQEDMTQQLAEMIEGEVTTVGRHSGVVTTVTANVTKRIYLGGPINGCTDEEASGWREAVKPLIESKGWTWVDPMDRDYRGREMEPGIAAEIVEKDKQDIDTVSIVLMNCPKPSVGSSMEVMYSWEQGKHVVVVVPEGHTPSPWLVYHASKVFYGSIAEAVQSIL